MVAGESVDGLTAGLKIRGLWFVAPVIHTSALPTAGVSRLRGGARANSARLGIPHARPLLPRRRRTSSHHCWCRTGLLGGRGRCGRSRPSPRGIEPFARPDPAQRRCRLAGAPQRCDRGHRFIHSASSANRRLCSVRNRRAERPQCIAGLPVEQRGANPTTALTHSYTSCPSPRPPRSIDSAPGNPRPRGFRGSCVMCPCVASAHGDGLC
jgi:hypothetical protein